MKNLKQRATEQQKEEQKEQMKTATKLVGVVNKLLDVMKEEDLKVYECDILVSLLSQRVKETANGYVGQLKLIDVIKPHEKEEEKES